MVRPCRKPQRDVTQLSGKPLSEMLEPSAVLSTPSEPWVTSPDLTEHGLPFTPEAVKQMTFFLMANPNLNSTVLFRADILSDSASRTSQDGEQEAAVGPLPAREVPAFTLTRTVVRRLVPRNTMRDRPLDQTCHFYVEDAASSTVKSNCRRFLAVYTPHVTSREEIPYFHPLLQSLAFLYDFYESASSPTANSPGPLPLETDSGSGTGTMSVHFLPYIDEPIHARTERTLHILLDVQIRIARMQRPVLTTETENGDAQNPAKDNLIPRHAVQDTYSRLKTKYAADLCSRWVEKTEPSKHVFEDLGVAAFLIELWRRMYGCVPADEEHNQPDNENNDERRKKRFPGFVDIACGNGVLVYILLQEGYTGWGFDARRRKTWRIFPDSVRERLKEEIYIPKPFADELSRSSFSSHSPSPPSSEEASDLTLLTKGLKTNIDTAPFQKHTFIISNHADELTLWTPLLALQSSSPFLAIPCCSHSLSGSRYRYPPDPNLNSTPEPAEKDPEKDIETGSLLTLRKTKQASLNPSTHAFAKSAYGCLTAKTVAVAQELGFGVERTLLRIPSTRNVAVLGGCSGSSSISGSFAGVDVDVDVDGGMAEEKIMRVVRRECEREGGVGVAARIWVERIRGLNNNINAGSMDGS